MRPFIVELIDEGVELLLQDVSSSRACSFVPQSQMHALMPAILNY